MRRLWIYLAWIFVGGAIGALTSTILFSWWFQLGWRAPIGDWLLSMGLWRMAGAWGLVWLHIPDWLILGTVGAGAACLIRRRLFTKLAVFSIAFTVVPWMMAVWSGWRPGSMISSLLFVWLTDVCSAVIVSVGSAALITATAGRRIRRTARGFDVNSKVDWPPTARLLRE
ncbi:hypothetical protein BH09PLA1_BH09PLA1_15900 [soil metagenome]